MAEHIPFITSKEAKEIAASRLGDSDYIRLAAYQSHSLKLASAKLWIDPAVDGMGKWPEKLRNPDKRWLRYVRSLDHYDQVVKPSFWKKPVKEQVEEFVEAAMAKCLAFGPDWITIPQLPLVAKSSRNRINRFLADATGRWRAKSGFSGRLILPLVLTHQDLVNNKTARNPKVEQAQKCFTAARADGIWVVETDLDDDSGTGNMRDRIESLVRLHIELGQSVSANIRVAGPYWGANLVLWCRGLVDYPAVGVGGGFQYITAGGMGRTPLPRVAISPLRRIAGLSGLQEWLRQAMAKVTATHPAYAEFQVLRSRLNALQAPREAKHHVAKFYKEWFSLLAATPPQGRALAMFQDLSSAYALGKNLPPLDRSERSRKPQAVAEPLMLNCF